MLFSGGGRLFAGRCCSCRGPASLLCCRPAAAGTDLARRHPCSSAPATAGATTPADFNLALDLGFLTKNRTYTFFKPKVRAIFGSCWQEAAGLAGGSWVETARC